MNGEIIENMHTDNRVDQNGLNAKHTKIGDGPFSCWIQQYTFENFLRFDAQMHHGKINYLRQQA